MTSAANEDIPGYLDLSLYDADEQELVDRALLDAAIKLPEWQPREGNTEVVLIEALALVVAELVYAINRAPVTALEGLLALYGFPRDPGTPPTASAQFTLADMLGHTIPAGTTVRVVVASTGEEVDFTTNVDLVIPAASNTGVVAITGEENTVSANGTAAGTALELLDSVSYVETVALSAAVVGGADPEADQAYYDRAAARLARLVTTLVLPEHFTAAALENAAVGRAFSVDMYNPALAGNPGDHPGYVSVALATAAGAAVAAGVKTEVETSLEAQCLAALDVVIIDPTVTAVNITAAVIALPDADPAVVETAIETALTDYLNPATWDWSSWVFRNELITLISNVAGVDRVVDLDVPASDLELPGAAPLASPGVFTITVS